MITLDEIRGCAMGLPEVEERSHFNRPGFRVRDKLMMSVHLDGDEAYAIVGVDRDEAERAAVEDPALFEEVWRNDGQIFVGLRVDLAAVPIERFRTLVGHAWRNKAPKRLVAAHDDGAS